MTHHQLSSIGAQLERIMVLLAGAREDLIILAGDDEPGYPYPDSPEARWWDYVDAVDNASQQIAYRLNTWDDGDYKETN